MLNFKRSSFAIAILSILLLILTISPVSEVDSADYSSGFDSVITVGNLRYEFHSDMTAEIIGYTGSGGGITIPYAVSNGNGEYVVTSIGDRAFQEARLTTVEVPDSVTSIGYRAFFESKITGIQLESNLVSIGSEAFRGCSLLGAIDIPESVEIIGKSALSTGNICHISIPESNEYFMIGSCGEIISKDGSRLLSYPVFNTNYSYDVPSTVRHVDPYAFSGQTYLDLLRFNEGLIELDHPIESCTIDCIQLPSTLETVNYGLFDRSLVKGISVVSTNPYMQSVGVSVYNSDMTILIASASDVGTSPITVPEGVVEIGPHAFDYSRSSEVILPSTLKVIGDHAFSYSQINTITIPESVIAIEDRAFNPVIFDNIVFRGVPEVIGENCVFTYSSLITEYYCEEMVPLDDFTQGFFRVDYVKMGASHEDISNVPIGDLVYDLHADGTATVVGRVGFVKEIDIPSSVEHDASYSVMYIRPYAFESSNITSVIIPDTVGEILDGTFSYCSALESVTFGSSLSHIGFDAFKSCAITSVDLPESLIDIIGNPFNNCFSLRSFSIPSSNPMYKVVDGVLFSKDGTRLIAYPAANVSTYYVPSDVRVIGTDAFVQSTTRLMKLNEGVEVLEDGWLSVLSADVLTIPSTVRSIGTFYVLGLGGVKVASGNSHYTVIDRALYTIDGERLICMPDLGTGEYTFPEGMKYMSEYSMLAACFSKVILPSTLETIDEDAFARCQVESVVIPDSGVYIKDRAFYKSSISEVTFEGVPSHIGQDAFDVYSSKLTEYYYGSPIPLEDYTTSRVTYIGCEEEVEYEDVSGYVLGNLTYDLFSDGTAHVKSFIGGTVFVDILPTISYRNNDYIVTEIEDSAFEAASLTGVIIPDSVVKIGRMAFWDCDNLTSVTLGSSVEFIGYGAFCSCDYLEEIYLPASLTTIESMAFGGPRLSLSMDPQNGFFVIRDGVLYNSHIERLCCYPGGKTDQSFAVPSTVRTIDDGAFFCNYHIRSITFNEGLNYLSYPIESCSVETIVLPSSLEFISRGLARDTQDLSTISFSGYNPNFTLIDGMLFTSDGCVLVEAPSAAISDAITIPEGTIVLGFSSMDGLDCTSVSLPSTLEHIDDYTFERTTISSIVLPPSLLSIGAYAFHSSSLSEVTFTGTPRVMGVGCFWIEGNVLTEKYVDELVPLEPHVGPDTEVVYIGISYGFVEVSGIAIGGIVYDLHRSGQANVAKYSDGGDVVIPSIISYQGATYSVTEILPNAFMDSPITSVVIPDSIISIGSDAFRWCDHLESVDFGSGLVSIMDDAFAGCTSLRDVSLPGSIVFMDGNPFAGCSSVMSFSIPSYNINYKTVGGVLFSYDGERLIAYPSAKGASTYSVPSDVRTISSGAFWFLDNCPVITLNEGLITMEDAWMVARGGMSVLKIPSTVEYVGEFMNLGLRNVQVAEGNTNYVVMDGALYTSDMTRLVSMPDKGGVDYAIPDGVRFLSPVSMSAASFTVLTLPASLEEMGDYAFQYSSVEKVIIPHSGVHIGTGAFFMSRLTEIVFLGTPSFIGDYAFEIQSGDLTEYYVGQKVPLEEYTHSWTTVTYQEYEPGDVPVGTVFTLNGIDYSICDGSEGAYVEIVNTWDVLGDVIIPEYVDHNNRAYPVRSIAPDAFEMVVMDSIVLPNTLTHIRLGAFQMAEVRNGGIVIPDSVTALGESAFTEFTADFIHIGTGLRSLDTASLSPCHIDFFYVNPANPYFAVYNDVLMSKDHTVVHAAPTTLGGQLVIPSGVTEIKSCAFMDCSDIVGEIVIPSSVRTIGYYAFTGCGGTDFKVDPSNSSYKSVDGFLMSKDGRSLISCPGDHRGDIGIPSGTIVIESCAFYKVSSISGTVVIPSHVAEIGDSAFERSSISGIILNEGLEFIGYSAFEASDLTGEVVLPSTLTEMRDMAFYGCEVRSFIINSPITLYGGSLKANPLQVITFNAIPTLLDCSIYPFIEGSNIEFDHWAYQDNLSAPVDPYNMRLHKGDVLVAVYDVPNLMGISINLTAAKLKYKVGDDFSTDGIVVRANIKGVLRDVTDQCVFSIPDMSTASEKTVYVSYYGYGAEYGISVSNASYGTMNVTFDIDGESTVIEVPYETKFGDIEGIPEIPEKEGHNEGYWLYEGVGHVEPDLPITEDMILVATWDPVTCDVTFTSSKQCQLPSGGFYDWGSTLKLPDVFDIRGFSFEGWSDGSQTYRPGSEVIVKSEEITFEAVWSYAPSITNATLTTDETDKDYPIIGASVFFSSDRYKNVSISVYIDVFEAGHTYSLEVIGADGKKVSCPLKVSGNRLVTDYSRMFKGFLPVDEMVINLCVDGKYRSEDVSAGIVIMDRSEYDVYHDLEICGLIPVFRVNVSDPSLSQMIGNAINFDMGYFTPQIYTDLSITGVVQTTYLINFDSSNPLDLIGEFKKDAYKTIERACMEYKEINILPSWKVKVAFGGYLILNHDVNGNILFCDGGFNAKVLWSAKVFSYTAWAVFVPVTVGLSFGTGFSFAIDISYDYQTKELRGYGLIDITIISIQGSVAFGIPGWLELGLKAGGSFNVYIMYGSDGFSTAPYANLFAKVYFSWRFFWWSGYDDVTIFNWYIGERPHLQPYIATIGLEDGTTINLVNSWSGNSDVLEDWVYSFSSPKIIDAGGVPTMIFLRGDHDSGAINLVYSRFVDGQWSEPEMFDARLASTFFADDSTDSIVWQSLMVPDGMDPYSMEPQDLIRYSELFVSSWDGDGFSEPVRVTDNDIYENFPTVIGGPDGSYVLWSETGEDGDVIRMLRLSDGTVETVYHADRIITSYSVCYDSGDLRIAVIEGKVIGEGSESMIDYTLYESVNGTRSLVTSDEVSYAMYLEGNLIWSVDGTVCSDDPAFSDIFGDSYYGTGLKVCEYNGTDYYIWFANGSVLAAPFIDGHIGEGKILATIPDGLSASYLDVEVIDDVWYITVIAYDEDGSTEEVDRYVHLSYELDSITDCFLQVEDFGEDGDRYYVDLLIGNIGLVDIDGIHIDTGLSGPYRSIDIDRILNPGDTTTCRFTVPSSLFASSEEVTFHLKTSGDTHQEDNYADVILGIPTITIDAEIIYGMPGKYTLTMDVLHTGSMDNLKVTVSLPGGKESVFRSMDSHDLGTSTFTRDFSISDVPAGGSGQIGIVATTESEGRTYTAASFLYVYNNQGSLGTAHVHYDDNGSITSTEVIIGGSIEIMPAPKGYDGWSDGVMLYRAGESYIVTGDVTFVPGSAVHVRFLADSYDETYTYDRGHPMGIVPDVPAKDGYAPGFWSLDGSTPFDLSTLMESDITLTACYDTPVFSGCIPMMAVSEGVAYVSLVSLDGTTLAPGTTVDVTFTVLQKTTFMGMQIYKPVPVVREITVPDYAGSYYVVGYNLDEILGDMYAVISVVSVFDDSTYGFMMIDHKQGSSVDLPDFDSVVSMISCDDDTVFVSVVSLAGNTIVKGTSVDVTFTALKKTTFIGLEIYKPVPIDSKFTVSEDSEGSAWTAYDLNEIIGDNDSIISVVSVTDGTNFGFMTLDHRRSA